MFFGEAEYTLDDKGRLTIPAKFRSHLSDGVIVARGLEPCLLIFTPDAWQNYVTSLYGHLPQNKENTRAIARFVFSGASDQTLDKQGRILLPSNLRTYAGLRENVVILGIQDHLEVWDVEAWQKDLKSLEINAREISENLSSP
jgi:MraZ protein